MLEISSPAEKYIRKKKSLWSCENYSRIVQLQRSNFSSWMGKSRNAPVNGQLSAKSRRWGEMGGMESYNPKRNGRVGRREIQQKGEMEDELKTEAAGEIELSGPLGC